MVGSRGRENVNPFNASCSKLLLFDGFSELLVRMSKIKNGGLDQYRKVYSLNGIGGDKNTGRMMWKGQS